jgi:hypothetical protein
MVLGLIIVEFNYVIIRLKAFYTGLKLIKQPDTAMVKFPTGLNFF